MSPEESVRTAAARGDLSARQTIIKALDALDDAQTALVHGMAWSGVEGISPQTWRTAADRAQLASDLLRARAEKAE